MATVTEVRSTTFTMPDDTTLVATRTIDAPREAVWAAHTQCEHLQRWQLGPEGWTMPVCEIDLRPGGTYRYVYQGPGGEGFQFTGTYREVVAPERIVNTEMLDEGPTETVNTLTLKEENSRTVIHVVVEYPSKEVREEALATGMLDGWAKSYDDLEAYLRTMV
jgi:uncharacterized protein YndB with AHSA1/START domain